MASVPAFSSARNPLSILEIAQQTFSELNLTVPSNFLSNQSQLARQALNHMKSLGAELVLAYPWQDLTRQWVFNLVVGQDSYTLPEDFAYFIANTQWDRTNHWPLLGPKTNQEWQFLKGGLISQGPRIRYRILGNKLVFHPVPSATYNIAMEYMSNCWVLNSTSDIQKSVPTADTDISTLDPYLIIKGVKIKIYTSKGFDTTPLVADFISYYEGLTGVDSSAPVLSFGAEDRFKFVGSANIPDGNWTP